MIDSMWEHAKATGTPAVEDRPTRHGPVTNRPEPKPQSALGRVLAHVRENPGHNQKQIITALDLPRTTVGTTVTRLAEKGLIRLVPEYHNTRYFPTEVS